LKISFLVIILFYIKIQTAAGFNNFLAIKASQGGDEKPKLDFSRKVKFIRIIIRRMGFI